MYKSNYYIDLAAHEYVQGSQASIQAYKRVQTHTFETQQGYLLVNVIVSSTH